MDYIYCNHCCLRSFGSILMNCIYKYRYILIVILLLVLGAVYFVYDPSTSFFFPKCPVMMITGYPCAGCGSQRAIHALLHLDIPAAARYNFLVLVFVPLIGVMMFSSIFKNRFPRLYYMTHHKICAYTMLAIILLWWVLRIIFGWYV